MDRSTTEKKGKGKKDITKYNCPHGKRKTYCELCGGNGLCEHKKQKCTCAKCKDGYICKHGKAKYECTEGCGDGNFRKHGKQKKIAGIVVAVRCANPHTVLPIKIRNMMDTVGIALPICFRISLLYGII